MYRTYMVICRNTREAASLFERLWKYLEDKDIRARGIKDRFTLDLMFNHDKIIFRTLTDFATKDGYVYDELASVNVVEKFLDDYERSKEEARITEAMNDML